MKTIDLKMMSFKELKSAQSEAEGQVIRYTSVLNDVNMEILRRATSFNFGDIITTRVEGVRRIIAKIYGVHAEDGNIYWRSVMLDKNFKEANKRRIIRNPEDYMAINDEEALKIRASIEVDRKGRKKGGKARTVVLSEETKAFIDSVMECKSWPEADKQIHAAMGEADGAGVRQEVVLYITGDKKPKANCGIRFVIKTVREHYYSIHGVPEKPSKTIRWKGMTGIPPCVSEMDISVMIASFGMKNPEYDKVITSKMLSAGYSKAHISAFIRVMLNYKK